MKSLVYFKLLFFTVYVAIVTIACRGIGPHFIYIVKIWGNESSQNQMWIVFIMANSSSPKKQLFIFIFLILLKGDA